jgi:hypothetical protein
MMVILSDRLAARAIVVSFRDKMTALANLSARNGSKVGESEKSALRQNRREADV